MITNEHVVAMVRNTLLKEEGQEIDSDQAVYEPKMTRSKVKKTIEENGDVSTEYIVPLWALNASLPDSKC